MRVLAIMACKTKPPPKSLALHRPTTFRKHLVFLDWIYSTSSEINVLLQFGGKLCRVADLLFPVAADRDDGQDERLDGGSADHARPDSLQKGFVVMVGRKVAGERDVLHGSQRTSTPRLKSHPSRMPRGMPMR